MAKRGKISKKYLLIAIIIVLSLTAIYAYVYLSAIPSPGHGGTDIIVSINANDVDLQTAISSGILKGTILPGAAYNSAFNVSHYGTEIWIKVNSTEENLQSGINSGSLCGNGTTSTYLQAPPGVFHYGNQTLVLSNNSEKTLQAAIDGKDFCPSGPVCGNGVCEAPSENSTSCVSDCPIVNSCPNGFVATGKGSCPCKATCIRWDCSNGFRASVCYNPATNKYTANGACSTSIC